MKKILFYTALLWANIALAQYTEWHVAVNGTATGLGTQASPWDLQTALNKPDTVIKPGDTVWLHGGIYVGRFVSNLKGNASDYITVSSYPGEWAIIDGNTPTIAYVEEFYSPISPCSTGTNLPPPSGEEEEEPIEEPMVLERVASVIEDEESIHILNVKGGFVTYKNFEITCFGQINRILNECQPNPGFEKLVGIQHNPLDTEISTSKCKFQNLVIRNIPGSAIGSWKYASDTEIYGCILYNNGYILYDDRNCNVGNNDFSIFGKGTGIYMQNATESTRLIENNFIFNNYDSGVLLWSANETPTFDYLQNFKIQDNILFNNGNPGRKHNLISQPTSFGGDSKPNLIIDSYSSNSFCEPTNVEVYDNVFYLNSRSSYISGLRVANAENIDIRRNYFFKGTCLGNFSRFNQNITFKENFYLGKRVQIYATPSEYGNNNMDFDNNIYYSRISDGGNNTPNSFPGIYQYYFDSPHPNPDIDLRRTIQQFRTDYPVESDQNSVSYKARDVNAFSKHCLRTFGDEDSPVFSVFNKIVQNVNDTNKFYITLNNPTLAASRNVLFNDFNIPNGQFYVIRDPQNYFTIVSTGTYNSTTGINFPLNLTAFEKPIGFADHCTEHTFAELSTFVVEFTCPNLEYDKQIQNQTDTTSKSYLIKNNITLGTNYIADVNADVIANASKQIKVISNAHFKAGSKVHLKIQDPCPDIEYVNQGAQSRMANSNQETETKKTEEELVLIYPNPNSGVFIVESQSEQKIKNIKISDINTAKIIFEQNYEPKKAIDINISNERDGLYIVQTTFEDNSTVIKTIIKK
jgi:hypothetical protein